MEIKRVTKKKAEELAMQLLGTRKVTKKDEYGYYFQSGQIKIRITPWYTKGSKKSFQTFFLAGTWYEGETLEVFIWIGDFYNREMFFTVDTMEEIYYEYKADKS